MSDLSQKNSTIMTLEERLDNESRLHQSALAKIEAEMDQVRHKMQGEIDDVEALYNRALGDNAILKEQLGYCKGDNERLKKRTQNIIREQEQIILEQGNKISSLTAVSSNAHDAMREMQQRMVELQIRLGAARKESKIIKEQSQSKDSEMGNLKKSLMEKTRVNHSLLSQLDGIQNDFREFLSRSSTLITPPASSILDDQGTGLALALENNISLVRPQLQGNAPKSYSRYGFETQQLLETGGLEGVQARDLKSTRSKLTTNLALTPRSIQSPQSAMNSPFWDESLTMSELGKGFESNNIYVQPQSKPLVETQKEDFLLNNKRKFCHVHVKAKKYKEKQKKVKMN